MSVLIIAEHDEKFLKPATLNTITAGLALNSTVTVLVAGLEVRSVAEEVAKVSGVARVLCAQAPELAHQLAEPMAKAIVSLAPSFTHILCPATTFGKNLMPRVAALLDVMQISDLTKIVAPDTFERPIYAGNAIETVQSLDSFKVLTIRPTAFPPAPVGSSSAPLESLPLPPLTSCVLYGGLISTPSQRPDLTSAHIVVAGGRGLQSKENFRLIEDLADCLKAAIGASRAAVDAGFVPNDYQVGHGQGGCS
jgi:electron transfer flavoprotein alpha subunit